MNGNKTYAMHWLSMYIIYIYREYVSLRNKTE